MERVVVAFGEIMCRLAAPQKLRLRQARQLDVTYAGAEASVAASICNFGGSARYLTALPDNVLGEAALDSLRALGVDTRFVVRVKDGRLGLYFLEAGSNQRPSKVLYDRAESAISVTAAGQYDWEGIFENACWLHLSGITPALSETAAEAAVTAAQKARQKGCQVSIDLNFRRNLWRWAPGQEARELARETMQKLLPCVDLVIANEEDCHDVLGIRAGESDVQSGYLEIARYPDVARQVVGLFPNVGKVAITLRQSLSANHNNWGAMIYDAGSDMANFAPTDSSGKYAPYEIRNIVDRVGGGDAFAGGLVHALTTPGLDDDATAIRFAVSASCLKHSIMGDVNYATRAEVEALMGGATSGRVVR